MSARYEPKGSTFLRSNHQIYNNRTLVPERGLAWHAAAEAHPKDYSDTICKGDEYDPKQRNLKNSTYARLGGDLNKGGLKTTTQYYNEQLNQKADYEEKPSLHTMIDANTFKETVKERDFNASSNSFGSTLPAHPDHHKKRYLDTTYGSDYLYRLPFDPPQQKEEVKEVDNSTAYKKCHSHFTDTADYRRHGCNTWQNETGVYENTEMKRTVFKATNPIPERTA